MQFPEIPISSVLLSHIGPRKFPAADPACPGPVAGISREAMLFSIFRVRLFPVRNVLLLSPGIALLAVFLTSSRASRDLAAFLLCSLYRNCEAMGYTSP